MITPFVPSTVTFLISFVVARSTHANGLFLPSSTSFVVPFAVNDAPVPLMISTAPQSASLTITSFMINSASFRYIAPNVLSNVILFNVTLSSLPVTWILKI